MFPEPLTIPAFKVQGFSGFGLLVSTSARLAGLGTPKPRKMADDGPNTNKKKKKKRNKNTNNMPILLIKRRRS